MENTVEQYIKDKILELERRNKEIEEEINREKELLKIRQQLYEKGEFDIITFLKGYKRPRYLI